MDAYGEILKIFIPLRIFQKLEVQLKKMLQMKVVQNEIPQKKVRGRICPSPPGVELGTPKICVFKL